MQSVKIGGLVILLCKERIDLKFVSHVAVENVHIVVQTEFIRMKGVSFEASAIKIVNLLF